MKDETTYRGKFVSDEMVQIVESDITRIIAYIKSFGANLMQVIILQHNNTVRGRVKLGQGEQEVVVLQNYFAVRVRPNATVHYATPGVKLT